MARAALSVGTRVSGILVFTPFPGGAAVPARIKAGFTAGLTILLFPLYGVVADERVGHSLVLTMLAELCVGVILGLTTTFIFEAAQLAGNYAGMQVGFSLVNIIDPQSQVETPVLSTLHQLFALLIFLQLNVHHWLIRGVSKSFEYMPQGAFTANGRVVECLLHGAAGIFLAAIQIAAPILLCTMAVDLALGFIAKSSPQLQVLFLGFPIKTSLALGVWMGVIALWPSIFERYFVEAIAAGERTLHLAK